MDCIWAIFRVSLNSSGFKHFISFFFFSFFLRLCNLLICVLFFGFFSVFFPPTSIIDHIVTMVGNLNHYEKILSRSHSNYLAQINIAMNERQERTADVLGRLTVLGTIVLPMNIITGLWGMNVLVPGQDIDNLNWFGAITVFLLCFGLVCYFVAKRVYGIV